MTDSTLQNCLRLVNLLARLQEKARTEGLLSLETDVTMLREPLLQYGLRFVLEGVDAKTLRLRLEARLMELTEGRSPPPEAIILLEGILLMQDGEHPIRLKQKLAPLFGDVFWKTYASETGLASDIASLERNLKDMLDRFRHAAVCTETTDLRRLVDPLADEDIGSVIVSRGNRLAVPLSAADGLTITRFVKAMVRRVDLLAGVSLAEAIWGLRQVLDEKSLPDCRATQLELAADLHRSFPDRYAQPQP